MSLSFFIIFISSYKYTESYSKTKFNMFVLAPIDFESRRLNP